MNKHHFVRAAIFCAYSVCSVSQTQEFDPRPRVTSKQTASAQLFLFLDVIIDI